MDECAIWEAPHSTRSFGVNLGAVQAWDGIFPPLVLRGELAKNSSSLTATGRLFCPTWCSAEINWKRKKVFHETMALSAGFLLSPSPPASSKWSLPLKFIKLI